MDALQRHRARPRRTDSHARRRRSHWTPKTSETLVAARDEDVAHAARSVDVLARHASLYGFKELSNRRHRRPGPSTGDLTASMRSAHGLGRCDVIERRLGAISRLSSSVSSHRRIEHADRLQPLPPAQLPSHTMPYISKTNLKSARGDLSEKRPYLVQLDRHAASQAIASPAHSKALAMMEKDRQLDAALSSIGL